MTAHPVMLQLARRLEADLTYYPMRLLFDYVHKTARCRCCGGCLWFDEREWSRVEYYHLPICDDCYIFLYNNNDSIRVHWIKMNNGAKRQAKWTFDWIKFSDHSPKPVLLIKSRLIQMQTKPPHVPLTFFTTPYRMDPKKLLK